MATFDAQAFLQSAGAARRIVEYQRGETVFSQGDPCEHVMYIQKGGVRISAHSKTGRDVVVALLGPTDFFGEGCLAGQPTRKGNATAITRSTILLVDKQKMVTLLHRQRAMSDRFIAHMLARSISIEQDLIDHAFPSMDRRLARALLRLARYGERDRPRRVIPCPPRDALAEMAGTTRAKVGVLLERFKRLGFIEDRGGLTVNRSLLSVVLQD
jgi:CRP-like cAMP-binding protein